MLVTKATEIEKASLEMTDKLYWLAELTGMNDDWVQETVTQIKVSVLETTGIDIAK